MARSFLRLQHVNLASIRTRSWLSWGPAGWAVARRLSATGRAIARRPRPSARRFARRPSRLLCPSATHQRPAPFKIDGHPELGEIQFSFQPGIARVLRDAACPSSLDGDSRSETRRSPCGGHQTETAARRYFGTNQPRSAGGSNWSNTENGRSSAWSAMCGGGNRRAEVDAQICCPFWQPPA